jgi:hypothetical protein
MVSLDNKKKVNEKEFIKRITTAEKDETINRAAAVLYLAFLHVSFLYNKFCIILFHLSFPTNKFQG